MSMSPTQVPLACVPDAIPAAERPAHFALIQRLFGEAVLTRQNHPGGYTFGFPPDSFAEIARFVGNEQKCCPFLAFTLQLGRNQRLVWLSLTGPEGTRAFLDAELPTKRGNDVAA